MEHCWYITLLVPAKELSEGYSFIWAANLSNFMENIDIVVFDADNTNEIEQQMLDVLSELEGRDDLSENEENTLLFIRNTLYRMDNGCCYEAGDSLIEMAEEVLGTEVTKENVICLCQFNQVLNN